MNSEVAVESSVSPRRTRAFARHAVEMTVAMFVGMALLAPLWELVLASAADRPDVAALAAATDMAVAMWIWMLYRGHSRRAAAEMSAAMYVAYVPGTVAWWSGPVDGDDAVMLGHMLMMPVMLGLMFYRRDEYTVDHRGHAATPPRAIAVVGHRAPTWIALAITVDNWNDPLFPAPWAMLILPGAYLLFGVWRGHLKDRLTLGVQLACLALYMVLIVIAMTSQPRVADWIVVAGWGAHALWDVVHHRIDRVVPRWWAEWCGVFDLVVAATIAGYLLW